MKQLIPESPDDISSSGVGVTENVNLTPGGETDYTPCTCLSHVRDIGDTVQDDNRGLMAKLASAIFNCLSKNAD